MINLKIPKTYLVRQYKDTAFGRDGVFQPDVEHFAFSLPGAELTDYTFTAYNPCGFGRFGKITLHGDWYNVEVLYDDIPITLKHTENREDGKRYKQYKITPNELATMYSCSFQHAVALVSIYRNNGKINASDVVETKYIVGAIDDCWFISSELAERRRLDTKGVQILGYISPTDTQTVSGIIKQHKDKEDEIQRALWDIQGDRRKIQDINSDVDRIGMTELAAIKEITAKALQHLQDKYNEFISELEAEAKQFNNNLDLYYIDKAA